MKSTFKRIVAVLVLALVCAAPAMAQRGRLADGWNERNGPQVLAAFKPVVADADKCTVRVYCDGKETELGTVVGADGWIATKYSELHDPIVCRLSDGKQLPAKVVGFDSHYDLAMLKVDAKDLKSVDWSDDDKGPAVGQLLASAAPGELPKAIGVVSVPRRAIPGSACTIRRATLGDVDVKRSDYLRRAEYSRSEGGSPCRRCGAAFGRKSDRRCQENDRHHSRSRARRHRHD